MWTGQQGRWHHRQPGGRGLESQAGTVPSGLGIPQLLEAVLKLLPLDTYVESPVSAFPLAFFVRPQGAHLP